MKMTLKPLQYRILLKLASRRQVGLNTLVESSLPHRSLNLKRRARWQEEIRLQIDLMSIYGLILIEEQMGTRICIAPEYVIAWSNDQVDTPTLPKKQPRPSIVLPLLAATIVATATSACGNLTPLSRTTQAPVVSIYNPEGTPPPERMEQFFNPKSGNMVYRFCVGYECPEPTPKVPVTNPTSVVTEIDNMGNVSHVTQQTTMLPVSVNGPVTTSLAKNPIVSSNATPTKNQATSSVTYQLNQQRRASLEANQAAQAPRDYTTSAKPSGKENADFPSAQMKPLPAPVSVTPPPTPTVKRGGTIQDMLPITSTPERAPDKPQANNLVFEKPLLATAKHRSVGAIATQEIVSETTVSGSASSNFSTAEAFVLTWADLWSEKKADAYFSLYASDFWPTYGDAKSRASFEHQRRIVMSKTGEIKVGVDVVKVVERQNSATVRFWQTYSSKTFNSRVMKSMHLVKVDGNWKIHRERLIHVPQNPVA